MNDRRSRPGQTVVVAALLLVYFLAWLQAGDFRSQSRPLPLFLAGCGALVATGILVSRWQRRSSARAAARWERDALASHGGTEHAPNGGSPATSEAQAPAGIDSVAPALMYWLVFAGYLLLIVIAGFHVASFVFVAGFLFLDGETRWPFALAGAAGIVALFLVLEQVYGLSLPPSLWP